jgi:hypothetical protein
MATALTPADILLLGGGAFVASTLIAPPLLQSSFSRKKR